ncbi:MAG: SLC13/DASS family transporter [Gammaproteobacteria bacterium]|nr:SLC13/DASS family transporter [Gammaproteobacteria bacterium]
MSLIKSFVNNFRWIGLIGGPIFGLLIYFLVPESFVGLDNNPVSIGHAGKLTAALACWMAVWWLGESIPIYATAMLPLAVLPLGGARTMKETALGYAHPLIFLFIGGFMLALALERWQLHKRFALMVLRVIGTSPVRLVGGFMFVCATMSMWITNTATTLVMLPIALSVIRIYESQFPEKKNLALCLLLGIAYSASIGGIGTIVGTVPNIFTVSFLESEMDIQVSFLQWMKIGVPVVVIFVPIVWLMLTRFIYPLDNEAIDESVLDTKPEPWNNGSKLTLMIFFLTAFCWMFRPLLIKIDALQHLSDGGIAVIAALLLFIIPSNIKEKEFLIDWETAVRIPWGIVILLGGGISLATAISGNGVSELLASNLSGLEGIHPLLMSLAVVTLIIFLTEMTSNVATTTALIPMFAAMAVGLGIAPITIIIPATIAASCAFMLPVATPPNAIVFGSGLLHIPQMAKAGIWLNIIGIFIVTITSHFLIAYIF